MGHDLISGCDNIIIYCPSSSKAAGDAGAVALLPYCNIAILVNDQREHPSSSPPFINVCPGNSTRVTDVTDADSSERMLPPVRLSVCPGNSTCVTDVTDVDRSERVVRPPCRPSVPETQLL